MASLSKEKMQSAAESSGIFYYLYICGEKEKGLMVFVGFRYGVDEGEIFKVASW